MSFLNSSTGTIRTCQKFLVKYNRQQLDRMLLDCKTDGKLFLLVTLEPTEGKFFRVFL